MITQDARWQKRYEEVKRFIEKNKRNPSKYAPEERGMVNWCKQQRKMMNAGTQKPERVERFKRLVKLIEENKRVDQYQ